MTNFSRAICAAILPLVVVLSAAPSYAQQPAGTPGAQQVAGPAQLAPAAPASSATIPVAQLQSAPAPADSPAAVGEDAARPITTIGRLRELSPWSMFLSADNLVKAVMISLIIASLATWTILLAKTIQLSRGRRQLGEALARISECRSLAEAHLALGSAANVLSELLAAAMQEIRLSDDSPSESGIKERTASRFSEIVRTESRAIRYGMGIIATVGATAPFVGLFGTVWGIMNSFIGISKAQTTNLAVVAPGIAEALLATAVGLAAAIPAVIIYNHFSRATKGYMDLVGRGTGAVGRLLSRDLDRFQSRAISRAAE
jgi:biopolymer transport protein ExbB